MCLFCDIIENNIPSKTIYEDNIVKCFLDLNQDCPGHILIVPKVHTLDIETVDDETLMHMLKVSIKLKKRLEDKLNIDGLTIMQNNGIAQDIKHLHIHLLPKYNNKPNYNLDELYEMLKEKVTH